MVFVRSIQIFTHRLCTHPMSSSSTSTSRTSPRNFPMCSPQRLVILSNVNWCNWIHISDLSNFKSFKLAHPSYYSRTGIWLSKHHGLPASTRYLSECVANKIINLLELTSLNHALVLRCQTLVIVDSSNPLTIVRSTHTFLLNLCLLFSLLLLLHRLQCWLHDLLPPLIEDYPKVALCRPWCLPLHLVTERTAAQPTRMETKLHWFSKMLESREQTGASLGSNGRRPRNSSNSMTQLIQWSAHLLHGEKVVWCASPVDKSLYAQRKTKNKEGKQMHRDR